VVLIGDTCAKYTSSAGGDRAEDQGCWYELLCVPLDKPPSLVLLMLQNGHLNSLPGQPFIRNTCRLNC